MLFVRRTSHSAGCAVIRSFGPRQGHSSVFSLLKSDVYVIPVLHCPSEDMANLLLSQYGLRRAPCS